MHLLVFEIRYWKKSCVVYQLDRYDIMLFCYQLLICIVQNYCLHLLFVCCVYFKSNILLNNHMLALETSFWTKIYVVNRLDRYDMSLCYLLLIFIAPNKLTLSHWTTQWLMHSSCRFPGGPRSYEVGVKEGLSKVGSQEVGFGSRVHSTREHVYL